MHLRESLLLTLALGSAVATAMPLSAQPAPGATPTIQMPVRLRGALPEPPNQPAIPSQWLQGLDNIRLNWAVIGASKPVQVVGSGWVQMVAFGAGLVAPHESGPGQIRMPEADGAARISFYLRPHQANVTYAVRCGIDRMHATQITATFPGTQQTWSYPPGTLPIEYEEIDFFLSYQGVPQDLWAFTLEANSAWNFEGCRFRVL